MIPLAAQDGATKLLDLVLRIFNDGGHLIGTSGGQFGCLLFGILLPAAVVALIISASVSLSQRKKGARIAAIIFLCIGVAAIAAFIALAAYAMIFGTTWAHAK